MYLQITTKCNFLCDHCCYSCTMAGEHGDYDMIVEGIRFAVEMGEESISIGGGEPTLHPRFFDILRQCLNHFEYVWLASNGSVTESMLRLSNIIDGCDYESFEVEDYCNCDPDDLEDEDYQCYCEPDNLIYQDDKLSVALSTDYFHDYDMVNHRVREIWKSRSKRDRSHYELRDVTKANDGISGQGRAKENGYNGSHCVCSDIVIKPDGKLRLCGCNDSPVIGDVLSGIEQVWEERMDDSGGYHNTNCHKELYEEA